MNEEAWVGCTWGLCEPLIDQGQLQRWKAVLVLVLVITARGLDSACVVGQMVEKSGAGECSNSVTSEDGQLSRKARWATEYRANRGEQQLLEGITSQTYQAIQAPGKHYLGMGAGAGRMP